MGKTRKRATPLPNGYGSVRYVDKRHSRPFAVYTSSLWDESTGRYVRPPHALCFCRYRQTGIAILAAHHAGNYRPGMEEELDEAVDQMNRKELTACNDFTAEMLANYREFKRKAASAARLEALDDEAAGPTFSEVYGQYMDAKYGPNAPRKLAENTKKNDLQGYRISAPLHDRTFSKISVDDLQRVLNESDKKSGTLTCAKNLWHQLYQLAIPRGICSVDQSQFVKVPDRGATEHGEPFTQDDIKCIWSHRYTDETAELLCIMIFSGFRISAYPDLEVNQVEGYFKGGVKTKAGKGRFVPIHPAIRDLVRNRLERDGKMLAVSPQSVWSRMKRFLRACGLDDSHSPHDCRHTFSTLCERYGVSEADRKRMMGHSFGSDITNGVYGHRTLEDLRNQIVKIPCPDAF